jgi:Ca2+-binding EF-hand superfamily protein
MVKEGSSYRHLLLYALTAVRVKTTSCMYDKRHSQQRGSCSTEFSLGSSIAEASELDQLTQMTSVNMGGCRSRPEGSLESQRTAQLEDSLGFRQHSPEEVHAVISRFIVNGSLDRRALKRIESCLGLKNPEVLEEIYNLVSAGEDRVPADNLVILSILLAVGSPLQKAELLWDLFDKDATGEMQRGTLQGLFEAVVTAATSIAAKVIKPSGEASEKLLIKWREDLKVRVKKGKEGFVDLFLGDKTQLSREEFFQRVHKTGFQFTSNSIRAKIEKVPYVPFNAGGSFARFKKPA